MRGVCVCVCVYYYVFVCLNLPSRSAVDTDREGTSSSPARNTQPHASTRPQPHAHTPAEESTSAGGGNLVNLHSDSASSSDNPAATAHQQLHQGDNFFKQSDWQMREAEMAGYTAFQDPNEESDSDSSSSESDSSSDGGFGAIRPPSNSQNNEQLFANFGAFNVDQNPQPPPPKDEQLVDFSFPSKEAQNIPPKPNPPPPQTTIQFDPWSTQFSGKPDIEVSNLLGLDDSGSHSTVQSEVTTVGGEQFSNRIEKMSTTEKSNSDFNKFDPFGTVSSSQQNVPTFDLLMSSAQPPLSTPSQPTPTPPPSQTFDPFDPLGTTFSPTQGIDTVRKTSTTTTSSNFLPVNPSTSSAQFPSAAFSHSQPNLSAGDNGQHTTTSSSGNRGTSSHRTSPLKMSPRVSPVPFGSAGNISQAPQDPFAQFNLQQMSVNKQPTVTASRQSTHKTPHPAYKPYYMQPGSSSQPQNQNGQNRSPIPPPQSGTKPSSTQPPTQPPRANYNPSFGGPPSKTGAL